jgi:hypothetical protein
MFVLLPSVISMFKGAPHHLNGQARNVGSWKCEGESLKLKVESLELKVERRIEVLRSGGSDPFAVG